MTTTGLFNAESAVEDIRNVYSGMTLSIMGYFFPSDEAQDLIAKYEAGDQDVTIPSGEDAVNFGAVSKETKTALLIAQAAERTAQTADLGQRFAANYNTFKNSDVTPDFDDNGGKRLDHADFKWVGSERDPAALQYAQGMMMASQAYLNNELDAARDARESDAYMGRTVPQGVEESDVLKAEAAKLYNTAADMLEAEGHEDIAESTRAAARNVEAEIKFESNRSPLQIVSSIRHNHQRGSMGMSIASGNEVTSSDSFLDGFKKVEGLVAQTPPAVSPENKPTAP
jgi:hypothetical protein